MRAAHDHVEGDSPSPKSLYLRRTPAERRPPPAAMTGAFGWLRANLLSSPVNIALTTSIALA